MITKWVVHQVRNGHTDNHPTTINQIASTTSWTTLLAVASQPVCCTTAAPNAASAVNSSSTNTGPTNRFQCGCRCSTTCSSVASTFSG